jgi:predicted ArsR family transcriptional regulator
MATTKKTKKPAPTKKPTKKRDLLSPVVKALKTKTPKSLRMIASGTGLSESQVRRQIDAIRRGEHMIGSDSDRRSLVVANMARATPGRPHVGYRWDTK